MTNGEKIKEIFPYLENDDTDLVKALNIDNLRRWWNAEYKEPTTKNNLVVDCISRQALYDALYERFHEEDTNNITNVTLGSVRNFVNNFPSITPIRPKGHWINTGDYYTGAYGTIDYVKCSCCGEDSLEEGDYCPNCGADMRGSEE